MRPSGCLLLVLALARSARADDDATPTHTARDVAGAPRSGDESGRTDHPDDGDSTLRVVARDALFVPKLAFELVTAPVHGLVWVEDRLNLGERAEADSEISLSPTAGFESGFGASIGARFTDRDTFGAREAALAQATIGFGYRARVLGTIDSGARLGALKLGIDAQYEHIPDLPFFGIGNGDVTAMAAAPIDPRHDATAVDSDMRLDEARIGAHADFALAHELHAIASTSIARTATSAGGGTGESIDMAYDRAGLVGFGRTTDQLYPMLELRWDDRSPASPWVPKSTHAAGTLARVFAGRAIESNAPDFWHYGAELQHYWHLDHSPRVFSARLYGEAVSGRIDDVPLFELPALGGDTYLRGYSYDRFRDRIAAFGELQYRWDLSRYTDAYVFVDGGRVYRDYSDLSVDHFRVGYGIGMAMLGGTGNFLAAGMIGSSIDGGIVAAVSINPVDDRERRFR